MTAYSKTWDTDALDYNAFTKRALDKVEDNLAKMWQVEGANHTWTTPARSLNTVYTNNSDYPMLVVASIRLQTSGNGFQNGTEARCTFQVQDPGDASFVTTGFVRTGIAGTTYSFNDVMVLYGIVNPGGDYQLVPTSAARSSVTIEQVSEFLFDAVYTPQAAAHGEHLAATTWWDTYADGVNALADPAMSTPDAATPTTANIEHDVGSVVRMVSIADVGSGELQIADSGGALSTFCFNSRSGGSTGGDTQSQKVAFVSPGGSWQHTGTIRAGSRQIDMTVLPTPITFVNGESGVATGDKFRDLDTKAAGGINMTRAWTRTDHGSGDTTINIPAGPPSIFIVTIISSQGQAARSVEVNHAGGTWTITVNQQANALQPRNGIRNTLIGIVEGGATLTFPSASTQYDHRFVWQMKSG